MPEICENWLGFVNNCIYYALQIRQIYQLPGSFEIHRVSQYLVNVVWFGLKDL